MQVIRKGSFTASPWKNGGGITYEAIRVPAGGAFRWRLSVAQIDSSGPFSDFSGYLRTMVLLHGSGVRLTFDGGEPVALTHVGAMAEFDGALRTDCQLLDGSCTDLNLMVARSLRHVTARVERIGRRRMVRPLLPTSINGITLVFSISGGLMVAPDDEPPVRLDAWDLAILLGGGQMALDPGQDSSSLVFLATLDDNLP